MRFANPEVVKSAIPGMGDIAGIGDDIFRKSTIRRDENIDYDRPMTPQEMERQLLEEALREYQREGRGLKGV